MTGIIFLFVIYIIIRIWLSLDTEQDLSPVSKSIFEACDIHEWYRNEKEQLQCRHCGRFPG